MSKFVKLIRGVDRFGHDVGVNYRGEVRFKTLVGVVATILNYFVIVNFASTKFLNMYTR